MQLHQKFCGGDALIFLLQERPAAPERDQGFFVVADRGKVQCDLVICRSLDSLQNPVRAAQHHDFLGVIGKFVYRLWGLSMTSKNADSCVNRFVCDGVDKRYRIRVLQQVKPDQRPPPRKNERQSRSRKSSRSVVRQKACQRRR